jgi:hypothetical protein
VCRGTSVTTSHHVRRDFAFRKVGTIDEPNIPESARRLGTPNTNPAHGRVTAPNRAGSETIKNQPWQHLNAPACHFPTEAFHCHAQLTICGDKHTDFGALKKAPALILVHPCSSGSLLQNSGAAWPSPIMVRTATHAPAGGRMFAARAKSV